MAAFGGSILLLLAAVALTKGAGLSWSDCLNKETVNILVPHKNCHKYYQCNDGKLIPRKCPAKLVFNVEDQRCDWPLNVDCQDRGTSEDNEEDETELGTGGGHNDPSEAPSICAEEESYSILVAHEYCNKYYICSDSRPVAMFCPPDLFFNANIDQCDWPTNVECDREVATQPKPDASDEDSDSYDDEEEPELDNSNENDNEDNEEPVGNGNSDPSEAPEICAATDSDGILIAHEYCNKFYICIDGSPVAMPCPPDLFFNANTDQCDYPKNVECNREVAPQPQPEASDKDDDSDEEPESQPESEPEQDNGDGDDDDPIGGGNGNPNKAPEICAAADSDGILVAHEYCNKYYICSSGRPVARPCAPNLFFNANTNQCDYPENVECDREVAPQPQPEASGEDDDSDDEPESQPESEPEPDNGDGDDDVPIGGGNGDPSEAPEICAAANSNGILVAHEYCNKYYICSNGRPVARPCAPDLFFNANTNQCDYPENVECDREVAPQPQPEASDEDDSDAVPEPQPEPVPEPDNGGSDGDVSIGGGNGDPSEAPIICAAADSDGILVAHEYCNKFYICRYRRPVAFSCPLDLFFNANNDQCDHPENVKCEREVAPQPDVNDNDDVESVVPETESEPDNYDEDEDNNPKDAATICAAEESNGVLVAHENCNQFYICSDGEPVLLKCPRGLFFNSNKDQCDWPDKVECDHEVAPKPQPDEDGDNENDRL